MFLWRTTIYFRAPRLADSINVTIDLLGIQMAAGLVEDDGRLDGTIRSEVPASLRITTMEEGLDKEQHYGLRGGNSLGERYAILAPLVCLPNCPIRSIQARRFGLTCPKQSASN